MHLKDYTRYVRLSQGERFDELRKIETFLQHYTKDAGINFFDIGCREDVLLDIVERVNKRRVYFSVFHGIIMSEKYEVSLYCFWINKLAPFYDKQSVGNQINAKLAAYTLFTAIGRIAKRKNIPVVARAEKAYIDDLVYSFMYWDLSKESMMKIADTLLV